MAGPDDSDSGPALLRTWSPADGSWYVAQLGDPEILSFTTERQDTTADDFRAALNELNRRDDLAGFAIVDRATGQLAGNLAAHIEDGTAVLSYWIAPDHRRRGMATDALRQMCQWIDANWQVTALALRTIADNVASQRVAENAGFQYQPGRDEFDSLRQRTWRLYTRGTSSGPTAKPS